MRDVPKKRRHTSSALSVECDAPSATRRTSERIADCPPNVERICSYSPAIASNDRRCASATATKPPVDVPTMRSKSSCVRRPVASSSARSASSMRRPRMPPPSSERMRRPRRWGARRARGGDDVDDEPAVGARTFASALLGGADSAAELSPLPSAAPSAKGGAGAGRPRGPPSGGDSASPPWRLGPAPALPSSTTAAWRPGDVADSVATMAPRPTAAAAAPPAATAPAAIAARSSASATAARTRSSATRSAPHEPPPAPPPAPPPSLRGTATEPTLPDTPTVGAVSCAEV